jgi:hypothetical protein
MNWAASTWVNVDPNNNYGVSLVSGNPSSGNGFNDFGKFSGNATIQPHNHQWLIDSSDDGQNIDATNGPSNKSSRSYESDGSTVLEFSDPLQQSAYTSKTIFSANVTSNYPPYMVVAMWRRTA